MNKDEIQNKIEHLEKELNELKKMIKSERWKPHIEGYNIKNDCEEF